VGPLLWLPSAVKMTFSPVVATAPAVETAEEMWRIPRTSSRSVQFVARARAFKSMRCTCGACISTRRVRGFRLRRREEVRCVLVCWVEAASHHREDTEFYSL